MSEKQPHILVAEDDKSVRLVVQQALARQGYAVQSSGNAAGLWKLIESGKGDVLITDERHSDYFFGKLCNVATFCFVSRNLLFVAFLIRFPHYLWWRLFLLHFRSNNHIAFANASDLDTHPFHFKTNSVIRDPKVLLEVRYRCLRIVL